MTEIVNLNKARKKKRAAEAEQRAAGNRAKFGRTKGQRAKEEADKAARERLIDGHKLDE